MVDENHNHLVFFLKVYIGASSGLYNPKWDQEYHGLKGLLGVQISKPAQITRVRPLDAISFNVLLVFSATACIPRFQWQIKVLVGSLFYLMLSWCLVGSLLGTSLAGFVEIPLTQTGSDALLLFISCKVWADDTAAAFRQLRRLCHETRGAAETESLSYEELGKKTWNKFCCWWVRLNLETSSLICALLEAAWWWREGKGLWFSDVCVFVSAVGKGLSVFISESFTPVTKCNRTPTFC